MAIFMIGTQRSGSNLLRLMLNQLPEIVAPHPPHILQRMTPLVSTYGDLQKDDHFKSLVHDVCRLVELNPVPWQGVEFDRVEIIRRARSRSLMGVFEAIYDQAAQAQGAATWCCKSLANIKFLPAIETHFSNARYIYLYRDGRDVAVSFRKAIVGEKHYYHIARDWAQTQRLALTMEAHIDSDRFCRVKYEDMVEEPEATMKRLCEFLGAEYRSDMLDFHETDEAHRAAQSSDLWGNVTQPIMKGNTGKFRTEASEEDVRIFESVAGDVLDRLNYRRSIVFRGKEEHYRSDQVKLFDIENEALKQKALSLSDGDDRDRRDRQAGLLTSIVERQQSMSDEVLSHLDDR
ncbi:MAG: sulfotransferase [Acidiferrobacterales bacterium]